MSAVPHLAPPRPTTLMKRSSHRKSPSSSSSKQASSSHHKKQPYLDDTVAAHNETFQVVESIALSCDFDAFVEARLQAAQKFSRDHSLEVDPAPSRPLSLSQHIKTSHSSGSLPSKHATATMNRRASRRRISRRQNLANAAPEGPIVIQRSDSAASLTRSLSSLSHHSSSSDKWAKTSARNSSHSRASKRESSNSNKEKKKPSSSSSRRDRSESSCLSDFFSTKKNHKTTSSSSTSRRKSSSSCSTSKTQVKKSGRNNKRDKTRDHVDAVRTSTRSLPIIDGKEGRGEVNNDDSLTSICSSFSSFASWDEPNISCKP